ncbi:thioredoxin family protein [Robertkochia sediminum]|uniref:thioredoxin family protein n=1 Tax=Robertkochia sediminum TaxID=2785326 RepID=UPI001932E81D|nr:thioredoxin family protein [Robertkochia sediminum]MBL7472373.1 thioredoxin family protein [Robertkochia sediminum]
MTNTPIETLLFSEKRCGICQVLKPKLRELMSDFPDIAHREIDASEAPEFAAQHTVFSAPTLIIMAEGKEYRRYHGSFSVFTVQDDLERLRSLMQ